MRTPHGYTLVEVLVVVSILAILSSILMAGTLQSRQSARTVTCLSNLHQIGLAIATYNADYDGFYPYALSPITQKASPLDSYFSGTELALAKSMPSLTTVLRPYTGSNMVFCCPAEHPFEYNTNKTQSLFEQYGCSYSYDSHLALRQQSDSTGNGATTYLMADYEYWHAGEDGSDGRLNELFRDLHVKNVSWNYYLETIEHQ